MLEGTFLSNFISHTFTISILHSSKKKKNHLQLS